jgi:hypothetical protein
MENVMSFEEVLEAADKLPLESQETLMEVLHRRLIERRREELAKEIQDAQEQFQKGYCKPVSPDELMEEISS